MRKVILLSCSLFFVLSMISFARAQVMVQDNQLVLDGKSQPQLFGAELQYFRLRGGYGKNVPREKVLALWNQALDRLVEAKMNTISFYIPWDFHEYAEGKFDFTGTADEDHDGKPDYPSRDLKTFFKLVENHGIHRIMVRPGPYINAEWGFLGFGAIPEWFHNKYPDSHMKTSWGWNTRLYDYHNPDLLKHTELWFQTLYNEVLKDKIGPQKPIVFVQLDNETNYQWQSIYNHDYSPRSVARYQDFLKGQYKTLSEVNLVHQRAWTEWNQIQPPAVPHKNIVEDQDWYRFADESIYSYLSKIRSMWEHLGIQEPQVLFTLAESYNATENGILPHFGYRNARGTTGMMTVNLYPKTDEYNHPFLNLPFKADLDVKSADAASDAYLGSKQEWVLGPEIQAGWWRGTPVEPAARLQTYLTVLGHGLKAFYVYYFNEGQNWDVEWGYEKTLPILQALRKEWKVENIPLSELTNEFWGEMQARADRLVLVGIDVRRILQKDPLDNKDLYFDAPLDGDAQPRSHFYQLKLLGEKLIQPYESFLARALEVQDSVGFVKDNESHIPSLDTRVSSTTVASDWSGGLLGYLMNGDVNPKILHGEMSPEEDFNGATLFHIDTGVNAARTLQQLKAGYLRQQTVVNFLAGSVPAALGISIDTIATSAASESPAQSRAEVSLTFYLNSQGTLVSGAGPDATAYHFKAPQPLYTFALDPVKSPSCEGVLYAEDRVVGYQCHTDKTHFVQIGSEFFKDYNSGAYGSFAGFTEQRLFLKAILKRAGTKPAVELSPEAKFAVAFARRDPAQKLLWVTVKTGATTDQAIKLTLSPTLLKQALGAEALKQAARFTAKQPLSGEVQTLRLDELTAAGLSVPLKAHDSKVFVIELSRSH